MSTMPMEPAHPRFAAAMLWLGRAVALIIAVEAILVAYFGTWEPGEHRASAVVLCTLIAIFTQPAAERFGNGKALWEAFFWILDIAMLLVVAYAATRFISAIEDMENLIAEFSVLDQWVALGAMLVLVEMTRRIFGVPLAVVAALAIAYCLFGAELPWIFNHTGFTLTEMVEVVWYGFQGVFGLPTGIVLQLIMIFIIFGAILQGTGAGDSLIKIAFTLAGGSRGGPAHAAVAASAIFGTMSGSVAANVVGTGAITIPLIKRRGFTNHFAGAVEAAASSGGQIMPPVMGAAAFLMAELVGIPYLQICAAALLPAVFYYGSLFVTVALEARRLGIEPIPPEQREKLTRADLLDSMMFVVPIAAIMITLFMGRSPAMAGFWAVVTALVFGLINPEVRRQPTRLVLALMDGGIAGAKIMMAVGAIGILLAILDLTGISLRFADAINIIGDSSLFFALLVAAGSCLILGMGMPTFPAYLIIVLILGPAIKSLGVPDLAIHLFVFYFGVLSAITPPVAIAAFAAAPIAEDNPIRIALHAVALALVGFIIPFVFVYEHSLLLVLDFDWGSFAWVVLRLVVAVWLLATAIAGFEWRALATLARLVRIAVAIALVTQIDAAQMTALAAAAALLAYAAIQGRDPRVVGSA